VKENHPAREDGVGGLSMSAQNVLKTSKVLALVGPTRESLKYAYEFLFTLGHL
jgi:hypothetical protein